MLLPVPKTIAAKDALIYHLALAVSRKNKGNAYLFNHLYRVVYTAYFLQRAGFGHAEGQLYHRVLGGLEEARKRALYDGVWGVDEDAAVLLEDVLRIHDQQLAVAAAWNVAVARDQAINFLRIGPSTSAD